MASNKPRPGDIADTDELKATEMDAAKQEDTEARYRTGLEYYIGKGVAKDKAMAIKWFRKAAKNGHAEGQFLLEMMYYYGEEVRQDSAKAIKWVRKAAEQGHTEAMVISRK